MPFGDESLGMWDPIISTNGAWVTVGGAAAPDPVATDTVLPPKRAAVGLRGPQSCQWRWLSPPVTTQEALNQEFTAASGLDGTVHVMWIARDDTTRGTGRSSAMTLLHAQFTAGRWSKPDSVGHFVRLNWLPGAIPVLRIDEGGRVSLVVVGAVGRTIDHAIFISGRVGGWRLLELPSGNMVLQDASLVGAPHRLTVFADGMAPDSNGRTTAFSRWESFDGGASWRGGLVAGAPIYTKNTQRFAATSHGGTERMTWVLGNMNEGELLLSQAWEDGRPSTTIDTLKIVSAEDTFGRIGATVDECGRYWLIADSPSSIYLHVRDATKWRSIPFADSAEVRGAVSIAPAGGCAVLVAWNSRAHRTLARPLYTRWAIVR